MKADWKVRELGEVCETGSGGTPLKAHKDYYENGTIPWLLSGEVSQGEIISAKNFISEKGMKNSSAKLFPKNTVLVAMYGATAGQVGILRFPATTNQAICGILPSESLLPEFLYYCFLSKKAELISQAVGGAQPNISQIKIKNTKIPIPPLEEQQKIVAHLDEAYNNIAKIKENTVINKNNNHKLFESYLQNLYTNPRDDWNKIQLEQFIDIKHGFAFKSEYFSDKGNYILLTPGNFYEEGGYRDRGEKQKYYVGDIPMNYVLDKDDLLIAMTEQAAGLLGSPVIIPESNKFLHNQRLGLIVHKDNQKIDTKFLYHLFNSKLVRDQIHESASGVKVRHTSPTKVLKLTTYLPNILEQQRIVAKLDTLSAETKKLEAVYEKKLSDLEDLKQTILQKAFKGELTGV